MDNEQMDFEEGTAEKAKAWIQENLRIIVSVFIVAAIALGIYSYSDRSVENGSMTVAEETSSTSTEDEKAMAEEEIASAGTTVVTEEKAAPAQETSRETADSFIETAAGGEGLTHLARKATANYLEKNPDSSLTAEHKVYIEDYLRKNVGNTGGVKIGSSVEFSKDLIEQAIAKSKTLNERQLKNLERYSSRVAAFR